MYNSYFLSVRQARTCRIAAAFFLAAALIRFASVVASTIWTPTPVADVRCANFHCHATERPDLLLPESERAIIATSPGAMVRLVEYAHRPAVRIGLAATNLGEAAPLVFLLLSVAVATWRLGARGTDDLARALPWLGRASLAALVAAVVPPLGDSLRAMLLFPAAPSGPYWYFEIDLGPLVMRLLLACAAFIVSWALAAGSRARRDLAEFV